MPPRPAHLLSFKIFLKIIKKNPYVSLCVFVCGYVHVSADALRGQRHWIPLEVELQVVVSCLSLVLGTELWSSVRAICVLSHLASFLVDYTEKLTDACDSSSKGCDTLFWNTWVCTHARACTHTHTHTHTSISRYIHYT